MWSFIPTLPIYFIYPYPFTLFSVVLVLLLLSQSNPTLSLSFSLPWFPSCFPILACITLWAFYGCSRLEGRAQQRCETDRLFGLNQKYHLCAYTSGRSLFSSLQDWQPAQEYNQAPYKELSCKTRCEQPQKCHTQVRPEIQKTLLCRDVLNHWESHLSWLSNSFVISWQTSTCRLHTQISVR